MRLLPVVALLAVVLAGCTTGPVGGPGATASPAPETPAASATPETPGTTATPGPETATQRPDNPWGSGQVVVGVENGVNGSRDFDRQVAKALSYWNRNAAEYGDYAVEFVRASGEEDPDLVVRFVETVESCSHLPSTDTLGCAPLLDRTDRVEKARTVEIVGGLSNGSTTQVLKHEFGHVLGIEHGERPLDLMSATYRADSLPQPDAVNRSLPWQEPELDVYVDYGGATGADRDRLREQVRHALAYYEAGADGSVPGNLSFEMVEDPAAAEVLVSFGATTECGAGAGSCRSIYGEDPDDDDRLEYYTHLEIGITGLDTEAVGWHVGYWIGMYMGAEGAADLPAPFRDAGYAEQRSDWWETQS